MLKIIDATLDDPLVSGELSRHFAGYFEERAAKANASRVPATAFIKFRGETLRVLAAELAAWENMNAVKTEVADYNLWEQYREHLKTDLGCLPEQIAQAEKTVNDWLGQVDKDAARAAAKAARSAAGREAKAARAAARNTARESRRRRRTEFRSFLRAATREKAGVLIVVAAVTLGAIVCILANNFTSPDRFRFHEVRAVTVDGVTGTVYDWGGRAKNPLE